MNYIQNVHKITLSFLIVIIITGINVELIDIIDQYICFQFSLIVHIMPFRNVCIFSVCKHTE